MSARDVVAPADVVQQAIDEVLKAGFATVDECIEAVEAQRRSPGSLLLPVAAWIEVIKTYAKTDLASLRASPGRPWRGSPFHVEMYRINSGGLSLNPRQMMGFHPGYYQASLAAHYLIDAELNFLKADSDRMWRKLLREVDHDKAWKGRSRVSAFDWYVRLVDELIATKCKQRRPASITRNEGSEAAQ